MQKTDTKTCNHFIIISNKDIIISIHELCLLLGFGEDIDNKYELK